MSQRNNGKLILATIVVSVLAMMVLFGLALRRLAHDNWASQDPVRATITILQAQYVKELQARELLNGALAGYRDYLKEQKKSPDELEALSAELKGDELFARFDNLREKARQQVKPDQTQALEYAGLAGMVASLDDPYCNVWTPSEYAEFQEHMSGGNFGGIGVYIELDKNNNDQLTVVEPMEGSPAIEAGLEAGDQILAIDGFDTKGIDIEAAAQRIRGEEGTEVALTIRRKSRPQPFEVKVKRGQIHVRSAHARMLEDHIGYLSLRMFGDSTSKEFDEELQKLEKKGATALILDLRNNGGGYIQGAIDVLSNFLPKGQVLVSVVNARTGRDEPSYAVGRTPLEMPVVVLINRYSASASEITAGALQDTQRAKLIGETSFGKASVQQVYEYPDGGALKYTVAHYLTPSGKDIHRKGIEPDLTVNLTADAKEDLVLQAAQAQLRKELAKK
ncbi:MAG: S41 family peptidase [Vulcanimicrobiota bacterium]